MNLLEENLNMPLTSAASAIVTTRNSSFTNSSCNENNKQQQQQQQSLILLPTETKAINTNNKVVITDNNSIFLPMQMLHVANLDNAAAKTFSAADYNELQQQQQTFSINKNNIAKFHWWHATPTTTTQPISIQVKPSVPAATLDAEVEEVETFQQQHQHQHVSLNKVHTFNQQHPKSPTIATIRTPPKHKPPHHKSLLLAADFPSSCPTPPTAATSYFNEPSFPTANDQPLNDEHNSPNSQLLVDDPKPCTGLLNSDEEDEMIVTGYRRSLVRVVLCWLCICLTLGILRLVLHWWRHWYLIATHELCPLAEAETVLVQEDYQGKHKIFYVKQVESLHISNLRETIRQQQQQLSKQKDHKTDINLSVCNIQNDFDFTNMHLSVHFSSAQFKNSESVRIFNCKQLRYAWNNQTQSFNKLKGLDEDVSSAYLHQPKGLPAKEQLSRRLVYGPNEITVPYKTIRTLLFLEVLNPFYVFQIFSVILWFTYDYYYYACVICLMSIFGITMSIIQTKKNQDALRETVQNTGCALVMTDKNDVVELPTQFLVPGDIIEIPSNGCTMQCDAVLLSGNCILDEAMLTGESVPVTKTPLPAKRDVIFDKKEHARHTLFCGTKVIQTRYIGSEKVKAIVINTGNITSKGGLIRSILYPPPVDYKFEQDSYKFIECLGLIALIGFVYTLVSKIMRDIDPVKIAVESLDLITIVVPPALPAAMTVGRFYAQKRLERNNIYCISPRSINVAGSIDCCCFDKTGTLTEDGLDMWGVVPKSATNQFQIPIKQIERLPCDNFLYAMVTCHSITILNGKKMGDPLDLKMFESTGWILEDPKDIPDSQKYGLLHPTIVRQPKKKDITPLLNTISADDHDVSDGEATTNRKIVERQSSVDDLLADVGLLNGESNNDHGIVREFPFTSSLQRMSVITRRLSERNFNVYCKGSPEMLQQLCDARTLPDNFAQQLAQFAKQGYRVIAMAYKPLSPKMNYTKAQRLSRESVESELEFLGFVVLENRLKPDTTEVIRSLCAANIRTIMVTGDNILTALSVARDCGIVSDTQAVVTVNVRQRHDEPSSNQHQPGKHQTSHTKKLPQQLSRQHSTHINNQHNYELYYTLELGGPAGADPTPTVLNGNGSLASTSIAATAKSSIDNGGGCTDYRALNGDVASLSLTMNTDTNQLPNSDSLVSVETCGTWATSLTLTSQQRDDIESAMYSQHETHLSSLASGWRRNYRFAMIGKTWQIIREHFPDELRNFLTRGAIYARMSPDQKQALIMELQTIDYCVAMCGDGANDCGALKVAHTGISLSETESSIASPFTSRNPTISCVPKVIKEGRAALVTSFGIFKYMAAYSLVQFISVMILYSIDSNLTDKQYLYIDLGLISIFAFFFGKSEAYAGPPVSQVPLSSLISLTPLASIILHLLVVIGFQVAGWYQLHQQSWFVPFVLSDDSHLGCYENYTMFAISSFQYIILAFVFSKGVPYRKPIWSNVPFCLALLINLSIIIYLVLYPADWLAHFFQLIIPPTMSFRYWMLIYGICAFMTHLFIETFVVEFLLFKKFQVRRDQNMRTSKRQYMRIEYDLQYLRNWPQITEVIEAYEEPQIDNIKPTYVEISAEQHFEMSAPKSNALSSFFEVDTTKTPPPLPTKSVVISTD